MYISAHVPPPTHTHTHAADPALPPLCTSLCEEDIICKLASQGATRLHVHVTISHMYVHV